MRLPLNYKIFSLFLPLTLVTLFFGYTVFCSLTKIETNNSHIMNLKDFQIQLKSLETWQKKLINRDERLQKEEFLAEIAKTDEMTKQLASLHMNITVEMHKRISGFIELSSVFSRSYLELFELYQKDMQMPQQTLVLLEDIIAAAGGKSRPLDLELHEQTVINSIYPIVYKLRNLMIRVHHQHDITAIREGKRIIPVMLQEISADQARAPVLEMLNLLEEDYLTHLAINDREVYLTETASYVFDTADQIIHDILADLEQTKQHSKRFILTAIAAAILLNLLIWLAVSRYIKKFLASQKNAISSIEKGNYTIQLGPVPNDEIGDLSKTMVTMAGRLEESQAKLTASVKRYRNLVENLNDILWETDQDHRITYVSNAARDVLGYQPKEITGRLYSDFILQEDKDNGSPLTGRKAFQETLDFRHKDGRPVVLEVSAQPVYKDNSFNGFRGMGRDITEKHTLEQQLQQSQKLEAIGRLAGGVAHDYNNILSVILGYSEISLEELPEDHPVHAKLQEIHSASIRSIEITRQLLAFARKQTIAPRVLDINDVISGMLKMLQRLIGENISLVWEPGHNLWPVMMDPSQLDQILANLCINARDAITDVGSITIETKNVTIGETVQYGESTFTEGDFIMLNVRDTGCGMDANVQNQIFEPFFTTKGDMGTGLGLSTVYGAVKQNNGFIHVYSEPEQGTAFKIYIPRHSANETADAANDETPQESPRGHREKVLLVEDEPAILGVVRKMLQTLHYTTFVATTPEEAIKHAETENNLDLLITDVIMPDMNGKELSTTIAKLHPRIKTLYMSGYTADIIADHGILHEGIHFIQKPFFRHELASKLQKLLATETSDQG